MRLPSPRVVGEHSSSSVERFVCLSLSSSVALVCFLLRPPNTFIQTRFEKRCNGERKVDEKAREMVTSGEKMNVPRTLAIGW